MKEVFGFRDLLSESEVLSYNVKQGAISPHEFVWQAYRLLAEMERSADARVRLYLIGFLEAKIRSVLASD
jgi:hypothetical protein